MLPYVHVQAVLLAMSRSLNFARGTCRFANLCWRPARVQTFSGQWCTGKDIEIPTSRARVLVSLKACSKVPFRCRFNHLRAFLIAFMWSGITKLNDELFKPFVAD
jgi:hypothetical protein